MSAERSEARDRLEHDVRGTTGRRPEMRRAWRLYVSWCDANGQAVYPPPAATRADGEQVLLRYLHSNVLDRDWSGTTVKSEGNYVARTLVDAGYLDPRGARWTAYKRAATQRKGPQQRVSPFTAEQVLALRKVLATSGGEQADRRAAEAAALIVLVDLLGLPASELRWGSSVRCVPHTAFRLRATDLIVEYRGQVIVVDAIRDALYFRVLSTLLYMAGPDDHMPLNACGQSRHSFSMRLRRAWHRTMGHSGEAWLAGSPPSETPLRLLALWWDRASDERRGWLVRHAERPDLRRDVRDASWLFVALCGGSRANEMSALRVRHLVSSTAEGHLLRLESHEHKGGRIALTSGGPSSALEISVPHLVATDLTGGARAHVAHCPACLLDEQLSVLDADGRAGDSDPLFPNSAGAPLNTSSSRRIVLRLWERVRDLSVEPDLQRVSTRSLRMTTATLGYSAGLSLVELADLLHHERLSTTIGYIHRDPASMGQLVMPYAVPSPEGGESRR